MSKIKLIIKNILLKIPIINYLFIFLNYKIVKTDISIHGYKIANLIMTKNNYQIYDKNNAGKITGLDNNMNYEYAFSKKIIDFAKKTKIFFDIGAAYGHYSSLASNLYKEVYCFEGDPLELFYLKRNMRRFKNVKIIDKYLTNNFNLNHIIKKLGLYPDIIKIDVESEEIQILENCDNALKTGATFLIEFHTRKILKKFKNDISVINKFYSKFEEFGYTLEFNEHHDHDRLHSQGISDKYWSNKKLTTNNFAIFAKPN